MEIILSVATILGGIAAIWYFWDEITSWWQRRRHTDVPEPTNLLNELSPNELKKWCDGWGKIYDHLNRIVLYIYPPQSDIRYILYFEFDIFSKEGQKQSELFNQGLWDHEHFPINDVGRFKSVYNKNPSTPDYINEWHFTSNARGANKATPRNIPSIEIYKKEKQNP